MNLRKMRVSEAIRKRRSIRKFKAEPIPYEDLKELVKAARIAPSGANRQPLEYLIVDDPDLVKDVFKLTHWAGYLEWEPSMDERPRAFIFLLIEQDKRTKNYKYDVGLAAENICLTAVEKGLGTCLLASIDRPAIRSLLNVPSEKRIDLMVAVGVPNQEVVIEDAEEEIEYWMDEQGTVHVPKRRLENILYRNGW